MTTSAIEICPDGQHRPRPGAEDSDAMWPWLSCGACGVSICSQCSGCAVPNVEGMCAKCCEQIQREHDWAAEEEAYERRRYFAARPKRH